MKSFHALACENFYTVTAPEMRQNAGLATFPGASPDDLRVKRITIKKRPPPKKARITPDPFHKANGKLLTKSPRL